MISLRPIPTWSKQSLGIHSGNARFQRHSPLAKDWRLPKLQEVRRCIRHNKCPGAVRSPARCCPRGTPGYLVFQMRQGDTADTPIAMSIGGFLAGTPKSSILGIFEVPPF